MPPLSAVQLATLVSAPPEGDAWLHEQKFDGYRILAELEDGRVTLWSRRWNAWTAKFPTVAEAVRRLPVRRALIDGEVVVVMPDGRTSFQALQNAFSKPDPNLAYFAFDLLELDDEAIAQLPLEQRKARLQRLIGKDPILKYSDHVIGKGPLVFQKACERGIEGIVSKRRDQPYEPGRGRGWVKTKCISRQELVIGGFTESTAGAPFGALLVGYYQGKRLVYAGKVGTGFTMKVLGELGRELAALERSTSPFEPAPKHRGAHWVTPKLVAEVAFSEWTADGRLRHPAFQGLRRDKAARDVVRELPTGSAPALL